jgi:hypothetical protein
MPSSLTATIRFCKRLITPCSKKRTADPNAGAKPIPRHAVGTIKDDQLDLPDPPMRVQYIDRAWHGWHGIATSGMMWRRDLLDLVWPADMTGLRICADLYLYFLCHLISGTPRRRNEPRVY